MKKQEFFQKLAKHLRENDYKKRYLEELEDHLEDSVHEQMHKGVKPEDAEQEILSRMGNPKNVARYFNVFMDKRFYFFQVIDALVWGFLSLPLYLASMGLMQMIVNLSTNSLGLLALLALPLFYGLSYIFYSFAWASLRPFLIEKKNRIHTLLLFFLPVLFLVLWQYITMFESFLWDFGWNFVFLCLISSALVFFVAYRTFVANKKGVSFLAKRLGTHEENENSTEEDKPILYLLKAVFLLLILPFILLVLIEFFFPYSLFLLVAAIVSFLLFRKHPWIQKQRKVFQIVRKHFSSFLQIALFFYASLTTALIWIEAQGLIHFQGGIWGAFIALRSLVSVLTYITFVLIFSGENLLMLWVLGIILSLLIFRSLFSIVIQQKWSWLKAGFIVYLAPMLFLLPLRNPPHFEWQVPVYHVSAQIEKEQTGPFYHFMKYVNQDDGALFEYAAYFNNNNGYFNLQQQGAKNTRVDTFDFVPPKNLHNITQLSFEKSAVPLRSKPFFNSFGDASIKATASTNVTNGVVVDNTYENTTSTLIIPLPKGFECEFYEGEIARQFQSCKSLSFQGKTIFKQSSQYNIYNAVLSADQKWLLLIVGRGYYDPQEVYLLELS